LGIQWFSVPKYAEKHAKPSVKRSPTGRVYLKLKMGR